MLALLRIVAVIMIATGAGSVGTWLAKGNTAPASSMVMLLVGVVAYIIGEIAEAEK
jgi:hypothetical protein